MTPRVSIVIPAWNAASFIEKTLQTVAAQTFRDFELIVVDDGSTDDTCLIVENFIKKHNIEGRCIRQQNKKIAGARNTGIKAAKSEKIAFLDHDDLWFPDKLQVVMDTFDQNPDVDLICHDENIVKDGKLVRVSHNGPWVNNMYEKLLFDGNALSPSATVVKISKLFEVGLFREDPQYNTVEDYDLWMRLSRVCKMFFIPRVLGEYQLVERGASNKIIYHNTNLELLLQNHFNNFVHPSLKIKLKMRRRLGVLNRSAARLLMGQGDWINSAKYSARSIMSCPWDWKNYANIGLWMLKLVY